MSSDSKQFRWACGSQPAVDEIAKRGVPVCLEVRPGTEATAPRPSRALCLSGDEDLSQPPVWCYKQGGLSVPTYWMYWSPCEKCGTAWRLHKNRNDDKSYFKLPKTDKPSPYDVPLGYTPWLDWNDGTWDNVTMEIVPCSSSKQCFVKREARDYIASYIVIIVLFGFICLAARIHARRLCQGGGVGTTGSDDGHDDGCGDIGGDVECEDEGDGGEGGGGGDEEGGDDNGSDGEGGGATMKLFGRAFKLAKIFGGDGGGDDNGVC
jgi:hypothetical protein